MYPMRWQYHLGILVLLMVICSLFSDDGHRETAKLLYLYLVIFVQIVVDGFEFKPN